MPDPSSPSAREGLAGVVRPIVRGSEAEVALVAERMRATLVEVLGEKRGGTMYTPDWLRNRVRHHLDPQQCRGEVLLYVTPEEIIAGHAILRIEHDSEAGEFGLFSTLYVAPESRRRGVAARLIEAGEDWFQRQDLREIRTYTDEGNSPLIDLFSKHGYRLKEVLNEFAILVKQL